jgi:hypothetical protein
MVRMIGANRQTSNGKMATLASSLPLASLIRRVGILPLD